MHLSRARAIKAAVDLIERDGGDALSLPALASRLGCSLLELYSRVPSTADLLDGVAAAVLPRVQTTEAAGHSWQDQVTAQARTFRRVASAHPRAAMWAASLLPGPAAPAWPLAVAVMAESGLDEKDSARFARALACYALGSLARPSDADADADFEFGLALLVTGARALQGAGD